MNRPELILLGAGGHAHACIDVIESEGRFKVAGLVGVAEQVGSHRMGYEVLATDIELEALLKDFKYALVTVGQIKSSELRRKLYRQALDCGFTFPTIVSPYSRVSPRATVGAGTIVMHGAFVNAGGTVGSNCILNTHCVIEHDVAVGDNCHISTGVLVNGNASVGDGSFIGSGSVVKEGLRLGAGCIVGMGSCVRHDLEGGAEFFGGSRS